MRGAMLVVGAGLLFGLAGCARLFGLTPVDELDPDAKAQPTSLVQQKATAMAGAITASLTLDGPPTAGNVIVVVGGSDRFSLMSPRGGGVMTWMRGAGATSNSNVEIWYGVTDGAGSEVTIECGCSNLGDMRLSVTEWSGLLTSALFEIGSAGAGDSSTTVATAPPIMTVDSPDLLIFAATAFGSLGAAAMGSGTWTSLTPVSAGAATLSSWYQLVVEPGTHTPAVASTGAWDAAIVAFRAL